MQHLQKKINLYTLIKTIIDFNQNNHRLFVEIYDIYEILLQKQDGSNFPSNCDL